MAISNLDIEILQHRLGCAIVQILDLVGELAELERQQLELAEELEQLGYLDLHHQTYLNEINTRLRATARAAFQRYPDSKSLNRYSDEGLQTLAGRFSSNPASLEPLVDEYRRPRAGEWANILALILCQFDFTSEHLTMNNVPGTHTAPIKDIWRVRQSLLDSPSLVFGPDGIPFSTDFFFMLLVPA